MYLSLPMPLLITSMEYEDSFDMFPDNPSQASKSDTHPLLKELVLDFAGSVDTLEYLDSYERYNLRGDYRAWEAIDLMRYFQPVANDNQADATQVLTLDDFFFMSPFAEEDASRQYFEDCIAWVERHYPGRVLSSIVFTKNEASYCLTLAKFACKTLKGRTVFPLIKSLFYDEVLVNYEITSKLDNSND